MSLKPHDFCSHADWRQYQVDNSCRSYTDTNTDFPTKTLQTTHPHAPEVVLT